MTKSNGPQIQIDTGQPRNLMSRIAGLVLIISAAVLGTYLVVAYFGWQSGQQSQTATEGRDQALARQVELARQDAAQGSLDLALRRLDWVLAQESGHDAAAALRVEIEATVQAEAAATVTPLPTAPPEATATVAVDNSLPELQEIRALVERGAWVEALPALLGFRQRNPDLERPETDKLLYETYLNLGLEALQGDATELGLNYLAQAERLGDLPQEAQDYRYWGNLYLDGIAYYGVNWEVASYYFRDLCAAAPFFQDSCQLLNEVLIKQADQLAFAGEWCPAEAFYQELWAQNRTESLGEKLAQARENCALATPVPISGTVELSGTESITDAPPGE